MDYVTFGRTGLHVSVMGLGCGGSSRIGKGANKTEAESVAIIRRALDAGVNFLDTAEMYETEDLVGAALRGVDRRKVVISTKKTVHDEITPAQVRQSVEASLKRLGTEYIDIYNLHGVHPNEYAQLRDEILPTFVQLREEGKIRFIGVTETFNEDKTHQMLIDAVSDNFWDVVMVGFNILNQTASAELLPKTIEQNIAVQIMFAVRHALSQPAALRAAVQTLIDAEQLDPTDVDLGNPLGFVLEESDAISIVDAAYRFCRYEPGVHVVLSGTGNPDHLQANIESLCRPPLPEGVISKLRHIFRNASVVTGQ